MEKEQLLEPNQSLQIIDQMVQRARFNFSKGSVFFIIWGALLTCSAVYEFIAGQLLNQSNSWIGWPIVGVIGGIASYIYGERISKELVGTHLDRMYSLIWTVFFATLAILIVALVSNEIDPGSYVLILTGMPTFFTGKLLRFKPLQFGGVGFWVIGILSLYFLQDFTSLLFALAIAQGYLLPGVIMFQKKD
jgi:hypothetical protein